jgi:hypothetical protein
MESLSTGHDKNVKFGKKYKQAPDMKGVLGVTIFSTFSVYL